MATLIKWQEATFQGRLTHIERMIMVQETMPESNARGMALNKLISAMWENYLLLNEDARRIHALFSEKNDGPVINDHIALRTFNLDKVSLKKIMQPFIDLGYVAKGDYIFEAKKLEARHFEHPDHQQPKIFISELKVEELSTQAQQIIRTLVEQIPDHSVNRDSFCYSGRPWQVNAADYQMLLEESEYAAWMAAFGYRPNHFTISINHLSTLENIEDVNHFLLEQGFQLNTSGGLVKGTPGEFLEQSATMANKVDVTFSDNITLHIPSCFYEFAKRYPMADGNLYQGFIAASADKIFESTNI